jgi:poly(3-hydroxybutyrate) depolymerase
MPRNFQAFLALALAGAFTLGACGGSEPGTTAGAAGTSGAAGTTGGGAGTSGAAGTNAGAAGTMGAAGTNGPAGNGGAGNGVAGTSGTAGTGAGTAGTGAGTAGTGAAGQGAAGTGVAGQGAAGTGGGAAGTGGPIKTSGCGKQVAELSTKWNSHTTMVTLTPSFVTKYPTANTVMNNGWGYTKRQYWTRPPANYDPTKAYRLVIWGQGCGLGTNPDGSIPPTNNPLLASSSIIVQLDPAQVNLVKTGSAQCFTAGPDGEVADSPELPYFDNIISEVESQYCVDKKNVFLGGYSSGGWFSSLLSCNRANVIRGTGWAAAGLQKTHDTCMGPVAALITRAAQDNGTPADQTMDAVENIRMRNGCGTTTKPWMPTWNAGEEMANTSSCLAYDGCMPGYPLIWCPTQGGHTNTEGDTKLTRNGLWKLWSTLPF